MSLKRDARIDIHVWSILSASIALAILRKASMSLKRDARIDIHVWSILSASIALAILLLVRVTLASQAIEDTTVDPVPALSHPGGNYQRDVLLEIVPPWPSADIRFTTDGRIPTEADLGSPCSAHASCCRTVTWDRWSARHM